MRSHFNASVPPAIAPIDTSDKRVYCYGLVRLGPLKGGFMNIGELLKISILVAIMAVIIVAIIEQISNITEPSQETEQRTHELTQKISKGDHWTMPKAAVQDI